MTEPEKEWLDEHFPLGYLIVVRQSRNILSVMHNPDDIEGFSKMGEIVAGAQQMLSDDITPVLIEGVDHGDNG